MSSGITKVSYTHDAMIDAMIMNPTITNVDLGKMFGYGSTWVSRIRWSEAFQKRLRERQDELTDPELRMTVNERIRAMVVKTLDVLEYKLSQDPDEVSEFVLVKALEIGSKGLGLGGFSNQPQVQVNIPQSDHLNKLAENLLALQKRTAISMSSSEVIDIQNVVETSPIQQNA
jgi:hypothetical protein